MANPLRVLVVEDSVDDTFFIVRELQKGGFHVDFERVETAAAMQEALRGGQWDLVISDYSMPQFDGEAALALYLQSGSDAPFIMVSGAVGEERAVELLKRASTIQERALGDAQHIQDDQADDDGCADAVNIDYVQPEHLVQVECADDRE